MNRELPEVQAGFRKGRGTRVFSNESTLCKRWPKYWSFSFSIIPSKEIPEAISFRMDWLDLLAVQGTLKSLLQHHSSKTSILQHSDMFCEISVLVFSPFLLDYIPLIIATRVLFIFWV